MAVPCSNTGFAVHLFRIKFRLLIMAHRSSDLSCLFDFVLLHTSYKYACWSSLSSLSVTLFFQLRDLHLPFLLPGMSLSPFFFQLVHSCFLNFNLNVTYPKIGYPILCLPQHLPLFVVIIIFIYCLSSLPSGRLSSMKAEAVFVLLTSWPQHLALNQALNKF